MLLGVVLALFSCTAFYYAKVLRTPLRTPIVRNLFNNRGTNKRQEDEADDQLRIQREILARRKNPKAKAEQQEKIEKRRRVAAETMKETMWAQNTKADVDPLQAWKKAKSSGKVKDLGYEEVTPEMKKSVLGFSLPMVQSPIDLPGYDNGQRFDLRLPYAERGLTIVIHLNILLIR